MADPGGRFRSFGPEQIHRRLLRDESLQLTEEPVGETVLREKRMLQQREAFRSNGGIYTKTLPQQIERHRAPRWEEISECRGPRQASNLIGFRVPEQKYMFATIVRLLLAVKRTCFRRPGMNTKFDGVIQLSNSYLCLAKKISQKVSSKEFCIVIYF